jgi:UDP-glucose 4-epimerase
MVNWTTEQVLVTGGASFIGSHLVEVLVTEGADVRIADDFSSGERDNLSSVQDEVEIVEGNLENLDLALNVTENIDTVFHLAADHGGRGYITNHPANCATNMALDNIVFEAAAKNDVDRIAYASSACTYPTHLQEEQQRLEESMISFDEPGGAYADELYGWAKLMGERSLQAFGEQYDIDVSITRIFTAYGPRENETHAIIALVAKAFAQQEPYKIWGDGEQTRNFTYVKDITKSLCLNAEKITDGTPVNAGISKYISINEVAESIFEYMDWSPDEFDYLTEKPVGVRHRAADTTRAEELLGWEPEYSLKDGLHETIDYYIKNNDEKHVRENLEVLLEER